MQIAGVTGMGRSMTELDPVLLSLAVAALVLICVAALVWVILSQQAEKASRRQRIANFGLKDGPGRGKLSPADEIQRSAKVIRNTRSVSRREAARIMLRQAGFTAPAWMLLPIYFALSTVVALFLWSAGLPPMGAVLASAALGPGLILLMLRRQRKKRKKAMEKEFPGALDIIVRGVKSGLAFNDCLKIAARDVPEPLRGEFATLVEQQSLGMTMAEAVGRFANRVPLEEANFFAIVIALQTRTGGKMAESLDNLVSVLRARIQLRAKIQSMSAEAKASGMIIGALPLVVATMVYFTSPDYIAILFTELIGNVVLVVCALWMTIGVLVMKKMIAFDY